MSKKIFSAQEWENVPSKIQPEIPASKKEVDVTIYNNVNVEEDINRVVSEIENMRIDMAPSYNDWVNLVFAIADGCGESGRAYFHRLSTLHHDYQYAKADKQYTYCLQGNYTFYIPEHLQMLFLRHYESANDECCDEVGMVCRVLYAVWD